MLEEIAEAKDAFEGEIFHRNAAISEAHELSVELRRKLRSGFGKIASEQGAGVLTYAAAGSIARLDATPLSDLDLVILTDKPMDTLSTEADQAISDLCKQINLQRSNPKGVFAKPVELSKIKSPAGAMEEEYADFSRRTLILLESTPLYNDEEYFGLRDAVIDSYSEDVKYDSRKNFVFLMNDVIRYFRSICVNYQHTKAVTDFGKWPLRNIKLRHSRVLIYFSMIAAIGCLSTFKGGGTPNSGENKVAALKAFVDLTPLQRIFAAYKITGDPGFFRVAQYYNTFLAAMANKNTRKSLFELTYEDRYSNRDFAALKANSDGLSSELMRFLNRREGQWDDRFFEYLVL
jgi:predicted nucleotidyltransferase